MKKNSVIDFAYNPNDSILDVMSLSELRRKHFEKYGVSPAFDKKYILPPSCFEENKIKLPRYN